MEFEFNNGNEIYQRSRAQIGPISLSNISYSISSERVSNLYTAAGYLKQIYFTAIENVPESFLIDQHTIDHYIKYALVLEGVDYPIRPSNRSGDSPTIYYFNSTKSEDAKEEMRSSGAEFVDVLTTNWRIKAILTRPSIYSDASPVVSGFNFIYTYG
tara:strand:- start:453 stop:923 length:471 start_codon:yes stop_codon:yes gene_type:complete